MRLRDVGISHHNNNPRAFGMLVLSALLAVL